MITITCLIGLVFETAPDGACAEGDDGVPVPVLVLQAVTASIAPITSARAHVLPSRAMVADDRERMSPRQVARRSLRRVDRLVSWSWILTSRLLPRRQTLATVT